ncbi:MAG: hypothetical protein QOE70_4610 [Chthoniobacter sp.]|jgi:uncharacterized protein (TIGR02599 family)|nr:hypothetical protein [Chthoniobacter sp.]
MRSARPPAFTLIEVMVSTALLAILLMILLGIVNQTSATWRYSIAKVEQFRGARQAFEAMTRRLSQATLNTYWAYEPPNTPLKYVRQSDLRFVCGSAKDLTKGLTLEAGSERSGHGIFFQAPLGFVDIADKPEFAGLGNLLNTWGYYVDWNSDKALRPPFIKSPPFRDRWRFRLVELMQPSNNFTVYTIAPGLLASDWVTRAVPAKPAPTHILAENVIALVLLPRLAQADEEVRRKAGKKLLAPAYSYDSANADADPEVNPKNQLPSLVQVTLVAIDEPSAVRLLNPANPTAMPDLGLSSLFVGNSDKGFSIDLQTLENTLAAKRVGYRVFTTQVIIRAAKWSRD